VSIARELDLAILDPVDRVLNPVIDLSWSLFMSTESSARSLGYLGNLEKKVSARSVRAGQRGVDVSPYPRRLFVHLL
jgi:hypothetical protein